MRGLQELSRLSVGEQQVKKKPRDLHEEAIDLLREDLAKLEQENSALRLKALSHGKQLLSASREARGAREDAEVMWEALELFSRTIDNSKRSWRAVREQARALLTHREIPPPPSLGSPRNRKKKVKRTPAEPEST